MRKFIIGAAAIGLIVAPPVATISQFYGTTAAHAQEVEISIDVFFDGLSDSGRWVRHADYNYVWVPIDVDPDWAPYTHGRWIYVDEYGWYFESDEPFAWAVYHYGRWTYDPEIGWFWVPGTVWAPAWVSWRRSGEVVGWAPLPPPGPGYVVTVEIVDPEPPPGYWVFVPIDSFIAPRLEVVIIARDQAPVYFTRTEFIGPVIIQNNIVINTTIDIDIIREHNEVEVQTITVVENPAAAAEASGPVAFKGKVKAEGEAAPKQFEEPTAVEAPTKGQKIAEEAAPGAADEEQAGQKTDQQKAAGEEEPETKAPAEIGKQETEKAEDKAATAKKRLPAGDEAAGTKKTEGAKGKAEDKAAVGKKRLPDEESRAQPVEKAKPPKKLEAQGTAGKAETEQRTSAEPAPRLEGVAPEAQPQQKRAGAEPPVQQAAPPQGGGQAGQQKEPKPKKCSAEAQASGNC